MSARATAHSSRPRIRAGRCSWTGGRGGSFRENAQGHLARLPRIDLVVVTHPDADHIEGVTALVRAERRGTIGMVLLPPILHPLGRSTPGSSLVGTPPGRSRLLADHIAGGGLAEALRELEGLAAESPAAAPDFGDLVREAIRRLENEVSEDEERTEQTTDDGQRPDRDESPIEAEGGPETAPTAEHLSHLGDVTDPERLRRTVERLNDEGLVTLARITAAAAAVDEHPDPIPILEAALATEGVHAARVRAVTMIGTTTTAAVALDDLLQALGAKGIVAINTPAPDLAVAYGTTAQFWHLAPTAAYLGHYAKHLPEYARHVLLLEKVGLPTPLNRASHVVALRRDGDVGVLCTGDAGFQRANGSIPDSMARDWEQVLDWVNVIDVPHHGGTNGHFFPRMLELVSTRRARALALYVSIGADRGGTRNALPHRGFGNNVTQLARRRGRHIDVLGARPPRAEARCPLVDRQTSDAAGGPLVLYLTSEGAALPPGPGWRAYASPTRGKSHSCITGPSS